MKQKKQSAAQVKAGQAFAAAGRASQAAKRKAAIAKTGKAPPRSKKQVQAQLKFAAAGRAAQARKAAHLPPLAKKAPALAPDVNSLPSCAAVAVAEHLYAATGICAADADVVALYERTRGGSLEDVIEAACYGFSGAVHVEGFWPCDAELTAEGLIYGVAMLGGYHAVLSHPLGMLSWGQLWPRLGIPAEAWHLEWAYPSPSLS